MFSPTSIRYCDSTVNVPDFGAYNDRYRERLARLIEAKKKGGEIAAPEEQEEPAVVNLMEALQQSLAQGHRTNRGRSRKRRRSA
jgi:non-homologous end joining protein Ku